MLKIIRRFCYIALITSSILTIGGIIFIAELEGALPDINTLKDVHLQLPLRVFTRDNKLLAEFGEIKRIPITLDQVPKPVIDATLATEDHRFFSHSGVDIIGLARAAFVLFTTGEKQQGGSTITMQVARNFFLTHHKTYWRKLKEILLALKIDHTFSKEKILELYFNKIFYGHRAYGIAAAAQIYYGKTLDQLTLPQVTMLAGLPKAPSALNPLADPKAAMERRNHVLKRLLDLHFIDEEAYETSIVSPVTAKYHGLIITVKAPYVAEMVRQLMLHHFGQATYEDGYKVYTTIDSKKQIASNNALETALLDYDHRHGYRGREANLGLPDLNNLTPLTKALRRIPAVGDLKPAVVLNLSEKTANVLLKSEEIITIPWENMSWARKQIMREEREYFGRRPSQASDILTVGDVIRVRQLPNQTWELNQLPIAESALVALDPNNGNILALTGGFNYFKSKFNRATKAKRQPGSSFKPFIFSAALEKGFTLASIVNDAPIVIPDTGEDPFWRPENDTREFYGPTRLRLALIRSRNLVSIRVLQSIGIGYTLNYLKKFGFNPEDLPDSLSLALGSATVTLLDMARAYAVFANGGYQVKPHFIEHIDHKGKTIYQNKPLAAGDPTQVTPSDQPLDAKTAYLTPRVITPQNAFLISAVLKDVIQHGTGRGALVLKRHDLAGKTGTTNDKQDAWFCGFNGNLVAITWMGFDQPRSLYEYAARSALPMWIDFMRMALQNETEATMPQPSDIVIEKINQKTGLLANPDDKDTVFEYFRVALAPTQSDHTTDYEHLSTEEPSINDLY